METNCVDFYSSFLPGGFFGKEEKSDPSQKGEKFLAIESADSSSLLLLTRKRKEKKDVSQVGKKEEKNTQRCY